MTRKTARIGLTSCAWTALICGVLAGLTTFTVWPFLTAAWAAICLMLITAVPRA